jgi:peptide/nickel transport system substrate-binding protein
MNGRELTAQDVVGAYQLLMYGDKSVFKGDYGDVVKVEAPDASTFVMTIKRARASWMHRIADGEAAWLANPDFVKARGADYGVTQDSLAGTGPFIAEKAEPGARFTYIKNPAYFEQPYPHLDRVQWLIIPDASTREAAFVSGQIHTFAAARGDQTNRIMRSNASIKLYQSDGLSTQSGGFIFNMKQTKWQDQRVRQAVLYAFPWERVITDLYGGKGAYDACIPSALLKYTLPQDQLKSLYKYDPAKATQLMGQAGFTTAAPLAFDLAIAPDFTQDYVDVATMLKGELDKVGFKTTISPVPIAQLRPRLIEGNFESTVQNLAASIEPDDALGAFVAGNPSNYGHHNDPKIEAWFQQQTVEIDDAKRGAITKEFTRYCAEQALHLANPKRAGQTLEWGFVKNLGINDITGDETREKFVWIER